MPICFHIRTIPRLAPPHLPPLSKVRCCRLIKFGRRPEGLPHHHPSPRTNPSKTALSIEHRHHPCLMNALFVLRPAKLRAFNFGHPCPSLVKGRWIDGKAQTLTLLHLLAICSPFLYCKLFCRQDGGIATPPSLASHQPLQNRTIPLAFRNANIYMHDTLSNLHYPIRFS